MVSVIIIKVTLIAQFLMNDKQETAGAVVKVSTNFWSMTNTSAGLSTSHSNFQNLLHLNKNSHNTITQQGPTT